MPQKAFIVLKSPREQDPSHFIQTMADKQEASVILFEDGIYHALLAEAAERLRTSAHEVLVSQEDLEARGFAPSDLKIGKATGYADLVDCIMERTERTITVG